MAVYSGFPVITETLDVDGGTVTAASGAATLNKPAGVVTSEALTTAAGSDYTLTLTNSVIAVGDIVLFTLHAGSNTTAPVYLHGVAVSAGSVVAKARNAHASGALNGTLVFHYLVIKP